MENSQENTTFILADVKVFDFLKEKAGDRKTKTEAYWDLLDRSMAGFCFSICKKSGAKTSSQPMSCDNLRSCGILALASCHCPNLSGCSGIFRAT